MFYNCKKLKEVEIIGNWKNVSTLEEMFRYDTKLEKIDFGDEVDMSGLRTVKHIFDDITNATDADRIFNTFAESFAKWDLGENQIFEVKENRTYTNRISNKINCYNNKQCQDLGTYNSLLQVFCLFHIYVSLLLVYLFLL